MPNVPAYQRRVSQKTQPLDISLNGVKGSRIIQEHGLLRVLAEVSGDGLRRQRQYDQIPVIRLSPKKIDRRWATRPILGYRPAGVPTTFVPKFAKPTHPLRLQRKRRLSAGDRSSSGQRPAFRGNGVGYMIGHFNEFMPGQSGGSTWGWWGNEPWPRVVGVGSIIGDTLVKSPSVGTAGDNGYGGGSALSALIHVRSDFTNLKQRFNTAAFYLIGGRASQSAPL